MFGITDSNLHQPILRLIAVVAGTILLTYIGSRYNLLLAFYAVVGGSVAFWLTWRFPFIAIIALFLTGGIPQILVFTPDMIEIGNTFAVGSGLNAVDIVLVLMLVAVAVRLIGDIRNGPKLLPQILLFSILLMGLWFFVSTIRNVGVFGIATVGEFRYRFLPLIIPIYIGYFCPSSQSRLQVFKVAVLGTVFLPLALFPKVGEQLGWQLGTVYRFLPPTVSLGMVCGLLALVMAKKYNYYNLWTWLIWLLTMIAGFSMIVDSPRSVWLSIIIIFMILLALGELDLNGGWQLVILIFAVVPIIFLLSSIAEIDLIQTLVDRGKAIYAPTNDGTASWRIDIWRTYIDYTVKSSSVWIGDGFGGHWNFDIGFGRVLGVFPHNLFVMIFVKMGLIGLATYLFFIFVLARHFLIFLRAADARQNPEYGLVIIAVAALAASQAFYLAYGLEYYTWLFVGLGIAAISFPESYASISSE